MVAEPLFTPVSFVRADQEEIQCLGGSLIIYGKNGVGKSYLLEAIASSLQGRIVGRVDFGYSIPEDEGMLGVIARLREDVNPEDMFLLEPPPGHYLYDQVEELRKAVAASRSAVSAVVEDLEVMGAVGELLDEFASLRLVFLGPLPPLSAQGGDCMRRPEDGGWSLAGSSFSPWAVTTCRRSFMQRGPRK